MTPVSVIVRVESGKKPDEDQSLKKAWQGAKKIKMPV